MEKIGKETVKLMEEVPLSDIEKLQNFAFLNKLLQSVVGVIGKDDKGKYGGQVGTGTFVRFRGYSGVLTAQHVIDKCSADELEFFLPSPDIRVGPEASDHIELGQRSPLPIAAIWQDPEVDVAYAVLDESADLDEFWTFHELVLPPGPLPVGEACDMIGFPSALAYGTSQTGSTVYLASKRKYERPVAAEPSQFPLKTFKPAIHVGGP